MMEWLARHWPMIVVGLTVLANVVNAATRHYSGQTGIKKVLLFVAEMLSVLASADVDRVLKAPLTSKKPK